MGKKKFNFGKAMKSVGREIKGASKSVTHNVKDVLTAPTKLMDKGLDKMGNLSLPLIIVGGVVLFMVMKNQK